jgi:Uma2 family endonuclease
MVALTSTPIITLPNQDQLPCDDGIPMETQRHKMQMDLLLETIYPWLENRQDGYASGNMFVYFSAAQLRNQDFKGPDFFIVLDVPQTERKSWVVWEEGKAPDLVIELLSESTATIDKNDKKLIYQNRMRVPEYFWYDPFNPEDWAGFNLQNGIYQPINLDENNRYISQQLGLALVHWQGAYRGVATTWLRWETLTGELLPTERESKEEVQQQANEAKQQANEAQAKAEKLAAKLREIGINPEEI